jgi:hypothetical protein
MYDVVFIGFNDKKEIVAKINTTFDNEDFHSINPLEFLKEAHPDGVNLNLKDAFIRVTMPIKETINEPL